MPEEYIQGLFDKDKYATWNSINNVECEYGARETDDWVRCRAHGGKKIRGNLPEANQFTGDGLDVNLIFTDNTMEEIGDDKVNMFAWEKSPPGVVSKVPDLRCTFLRTNVKYDKDKLIRALGKYPYDKLKRRSPSSGLFSAEPRDDEHTILVCTKD